MTVLLAGLRRLPCAATLPLVLLLAVGSMLGLTAVLSKAAALNGWAPMGVLAWAMLGAAALQFAVLAARGVRFNTAPRYLRYYLAAGLLFALTNGLAFSAARHVGAGVVALCFAFPLILTYGLALPLGLERFHPVRLAGVLAGLAGAVVIAFGSRIAGDGLVSPWLTAALAAPVAAAVGNIYRSVDWPAGATAVDLSPGMVLVAGLAVAAFTQVTGRPLTPAAWSMTVLAFPAALIAIFALLYVLMFLLQDRAGPVYLSQIGSVGAVVGVVLGAMWLDEAVTVRLLVAGLCIALGIVLVNRHQARARE